MMIMIGQPMHVQAQGCDLTADKDSLDNKICMFLRNRMLLSDGDEGAAVNSI